LLIHLVLGLFGIGRPDDLQTDHVEALAEQIRGDRQVRERAVFAGGAVGQRFPRGDVFPLHLLAVDVNDQSAAISDGK